MSTRHERCDDAGPACGCRSARFDRAGGILDRSLRGKRARAVVARVGVLEYPELGLDELVSADALRRVDSLVGRPVVVGHPDPDASGSRFVRADTVIVGRVASARFDAERGEVHAELEITDSTVLGDIAAGALAEVSPGYSSATREERGSWQGRRYDTVQTDREYDHVALLPPGHARCGSTCSCRVDAARATKERTDSMQTEEMLRRWEDRLDARQKRMDEEAAKLEQEKKDAEAKAAEESQKTDADKAALEAERDALKAKLAEVETKLASATSEEAMDARADARAALVTTYRRVLGADAPLERTDDKGAKKRLNDREIKLAVLAKLGRTVEAGKPDAYVDARFDHEVELLGKAPSSALTHDLASLYTPPAQHVDSTGAPPPATSPHTAGRTPPTPIGSRYLRG